MASFTAKFKNIFTPIDIICPFYKHYHLVGELLESIIRKTMGIAYTVTLVDDCSPNKDFLKDLEKRKLKKIPLQYIQQPKQKGFGAALKAGFDATKNQWICFLHSDCRIERTDWLINMMTTMNTLKKDGVKLVSAKVNDGGTGFFDPAIINVPGNTNNIIVGSPLPLICCVVHRDLFDSIGGFVKEYPYGWYEDEELFWRMKLKNFKQAVCGTSLVHHGGGVAIKELVKDRNIKKIMEGNQETCVSDVRTFAKSHQGFSLKH